MALPNLLNNRPINKDRDSSTEPQTEEKKVNFDDLDLSAFNSAKTQNSSIQNNNNNKSSLNDKKRKEVLKILEQRINSVRRGTSEEADVVNSKVLMEAPEDFFDKYQEGVAIVTDWIQTQMSEKNDEANIIQKLKQDPTNIDNREIAFKIINRHFINFESNPRTFQDYNAIYNPFDKKVILSLVVHEICGLGPLEPLFRDFALKELVCNGPFDIQVEKGGKMVKVKACKFRNPEHLKALIDRLYNSVNKQITKATPMERARLHDNSRVFAVDSSVAPNGPSLNIRRHTDDWVSPDMLLKYESGSKEMLEWLGQHIHAELNLIVAGGTATGKSLSLFTPIPTPNGFKLLGNLQVGDVIYDTNGRRTTITAIYDQEPRNVVKINFSNSRTVKCDLEHNWYVSTLENPDVFETLTTEQIIKNGFDKYLIPLSSSPVRFDDSKTIKYTGILTKDVEIKNVIKNLDYIDLLKEYEFAPVNTREKLVSEVYLRYPDLDLNNYPVLKRIVRSLGYKDLSSLENTSALCFETIKEVIYTDKKEKMRCLTVDSDTHTYLFGEDYLTTHNTTLLAALTGFYRNDARLLTVERNIELRPAPGKLWGTPMEVIPPNPGAQTLGVDMRTLVEATTQMRPDGIILGETTGPEAWDVTQALNSGHFGATTIHANSSQDTIQRLIALISQSDVIKGEALLEMISSSFDIIVVTTRFPQDGSRKITEVCEIDTKISKNEAGMPFLAVKPIWKFEPDEFSKTPGAKVRGIWRKVGELSEERRIKHHLDLVTMKPWEELKKLYEEEK